MGLSELTIKVILLFFPGLIAFVIVDQLTVHKEYKGHFVFIYALILGIFSYFFYFLIITTVNYFFETKFSINFIKSLTEKNANIDVKEVIFTTFFGAFIGLAFSFSINRNYFFRFSRKLGLSNKIGEIGVWSHLFQFGESHYVVIRDIEADLMFKGWIALNSDETDNREEIFLRDVSVFQNSSGKHYYSTPALYFSRKKEHLIIDFIDFEYTKDVNSIDAENTQDNGC